MRERALALLVMTLSACSDDSPGLRLDVRVPSPVTPDTAMPAGICPSPGGDHLPIGVGQVTGVRITALAPGATPAFLCDYMLNVTGGGNTQEILIPGPMPLVDLLLDAFGDVPVGGTTRPLLFSGEQRGVAVAGGSAQVLMLRPLSFGCLPAHLARPRAFHSATPLSDGSVLIAGGVTSFSDVTGQKLVATESIEVYDPHSRAFTVPIDRRPLKIARAFHQAIALPTTPDGKVIVMLVGGVSPPNGDPAQPVAGFRSGSEPLRVMPLGTAVAAGVEFVIYDPIAHTINTAAAPTTGFAPRMFPAVTGVPGPILALAIAGGVSKAGTMFLPADAVSSIEQVDKTNGTLLPGGAMASLREQRVGTSLTPLDANRAILFGGDMSAAATTENAHSSELVGGIGTASVTSTALTVPMTTSVLATAFHTATRLDDGSVAIIGGFLVQGGVAINTNDSAPLQKINVDMMNNLVTTPLGAGGFVGVGYHATTLVPEANALLVSGGSPAMSVMGCGLFCSSQGAYLIDKTSVMIRSLHQLSVGRYGHQQSLLADGTVLVTGGLRRQPDKHDAIALVLDSVEEFNPHDATFDRVNLAPLSLARPAGQALGDIDAKKRCLTRDEYKKMHP